MEIQSDDYHDFVFKDGRLVGEFEQMYRKSKEVPWHQDRDSERLDCQLALDLIASEGIRGSVLEIGCGLGYFGSILVDKIKPKSFVGTDLSPTAVAKAAGLFPGSKFEVLDVVAELDSQGWAGRSFDLVVIRGCFWYLFDHMAQVVDNLALLTKPNGTVFVAQNFPPLDRNFIGKEILPNPGALMNFFKGRFDIYLTNGLTDLRAGKNNDNWIFFLGTRR